MILFGVNFTELVPVDPFWVNVVVLVGAIAAFVLFIAIAGFWLSRQEFEEST